MSHDLDRSKGYYAFVSYAQPGWHGLGKVSKDAINTEMALRDGGLDFEVIKRSNVHTKQDTDDNCFFTYRTDVRKILGRRLGKDYEVLQNKEALAIVNEILESGAVTIETCGAINEGRKVFICMKIKQNIIVGESDMVEQYILIATSHDGSLSPTAIATNIRVVCQNTLSAALGNAVGQINIGYPRDADDRAREAAKVLKLIKENSEANRNNYNKMLNTVITKERMRDYFANIFYTPDEIDKLQNGKQPEDVMSKEKRNILTGVEYATFYGAGQAPALPNGNITMWSAYNGVTNYITNKKYASINDRANSLLFGHSANIVELAGNFALEIDNLGKVKPLYKIFKEKRFELELKPAPLPFY